MDCTRLLHLNSYPSHRDDWLYIKLNWSQREYIHTKHRSLFFLFDIWMKMLHAPTRIININFYFVCFFPPFFLLVRHWEKINSRGLVRQLIDSTCMVELAAPHSEAFYFWTEISTAFSMWFICFSFILIFIWYYTISGCIYK